MTKPQSKSTDRKFEADLSPAAGLRLVPAARSSARQPVEGEFPNEENYYDPEQRQRTVGKLIDFFKKY